MTRIHGERSGSAPITLRYLRPPGLDCRELDRKIAEVGRRYAEVLAIEVVAPGPSAHAAPTVLLLRAGEIVGEAMGMLLPAWELDRVVRCAVEWPACT